MRDGTRELGVVEETLCFLESHRAVLTAARVDLESFLVGVDFELDSRPGAAKTGDRSFFAPVEGAVLVAVGEVAGI